MREFDHHKIEKKWRKKWEQDGLNTTPDEVKGKENYYALFEFPYPSGNLHIGHWYAYSVPDIFARFKRMQGYNVLYPVGFDAFGLPAENAAIKRNLNPREWTYDNIDHMKDQLKNMGCMFDWSREIITADPGYYRWTQWLFTQFLKNGLAYQKELPVNWCSSCKTGLANEQVVNGLCERCDTPIEMRELPQWNIKITDYADRLLEDLEDLAWPDEIKTLQRNWIGKKEGTKFAFKLNSIPGQDDGAHSVEVFTTRPDTFFGVTFLVISPEKAKEWIDLGWQASDEVTKYVETSLKKETQERASEKKEKTGIDAGITATHPATGEEIPVWIADYVLGGYGTGAIMAVPAHDERDHAFAEKYDLPIQQVVASYYKDEANPPHEGKKSVPREMIQALIRNPETGEYLCLEWKEHPWTTFVIGGVEEGEDPLEAATREIYEETGYKNVKLIKEFPGIVCSEYFAAHKDENRLAFTTGFLFELENDEQDEIASEELEKHEPIWLPREEITDERMTCSELSYWFERIDNDEVVAYTGEGVLMNSGEFDGLKSEEAREQITKKYGESSVTYNLRDWGVSRQRYWGCPIPVIHCEKCGAVPVPDEDLPVTLPEINDYLPRDDGRSPLAKATDWMKTECPECGGGAERETDTLDTFIDSSWYFLRYLDPHNDEEFSRKDLQEKWMPVDRYSGGAEHTTVHLLYSRFFYKALYDFGLVTENEPYARRFNRSLILGPDGQKMSKSRGNVIDPDDIVGRVGSDSVRTYLAFIGPYNEVGTYPWDLGGVVGVRRFLERVYALVERVSDEKDAPLDPLIHKTIKSVGESIERYKINTGVSSLMECTNVLMKRESVPRGVMETVVRLVAPYAPHIAEEMWEELGHTTSVHLESWPEYDESVLVEEEMEIVVQVNGKVRASFTAKQGSDNEEIEEKAKEIPQVQKYLEGEEIKRVIVVPDRLINFVV